MKKSAFTLAEILISLMILGVIASLTIPSLIQNTQKKEQVVQLKKGLSMINQAISMHYALTSEDFSTSELNSTANVINMLKKRLSVVASGADWVRTQDGLTYFISAKMGGSCGVTDAPAVDGNNAGTGACYGIVISTKGSDSWATTGGQYTTAQGKVATSGDKALTGYYQFYASADRVVPTSDAQAVMNATDATTVSAGATGS